jgi:hypothetical protein
MPARPLLSCRLSLLRPGDRELTILRVYPWPPRPPPASLPRAAALPSLTRGRRSSGAGCRRSVREAERVAADSPPRNARRLPPPLAPPPPLPLPAKYLSFIL